MAETVRSRAQKLLAGTRSFKRYLMILAVAAIAVVVTVAVVLMQHGMAMNRTVAVLDCHAVPGVAHTHNADCFDASGNLVCPLPEVEAHTHDDSCYAGSRELVCGLEESEGHQHTEACFDADGNLICDLEESEGHLHTDACYEVTRELVCGKEEITEVHVHGPGCFVTTQMDDGVPEVDDEPEAGQGLETDQAGDIRAGSAEDHGDAGSSDDVDGVTQDGDVTEADDSWDIEVDSNTAAAMPEQTFTHSFKQLDDYGNENVVLCVDVLAPEGALPVGSTMEATWVEPAEMSADEQAALDEALAQKTEGKVLEQQAVDITFRDADGAEVEPARKVQVTFTSPILSTKDQPVVVHIEDEEEAKARAELEGESQATLEASVIDNLGDRTLAQRDVTLEDDQVAFDADAFSTYVLSVTSLKHTMRVNEETVNITVDAQAAAGIPADATLRVTEIAAGGEAYDGYVSQAESAMGVDDPRDVALARFFDITIVDGAGNELQPSEPVQVRIELAGAPAEAGAEASVLHFADDAAGPEVVEAEAESNTTTFEAEGFSVYGVVYTVDFHYESKNENGPKSFDFSINGGCSITLSELVKVLGILEDTDYKDSDAFLRDVEDVTFSDESLVKVVKIEENASVASVLKSVFDVSAVGEEEKTDDEAGTGFVTAGDWLLVSVAPFHTAETLTIAMNDGERIVIDVTDEETANLADFITDATIEIEGRIYGADETWPVRQDVGYALKLTFKEKGLRQFPTGEAEMVMTPADLGGMTLIPNQQGTFDIPMGLYGTVTGNRWWVGDDGKLHIKFGRDPDDLLTRSNNTYLNISFDVSFHGIEGVIQFNDTVTREWKANEDTDIDLTKNGHYNPVTGQMNYTITVTSTGHTHNIRVTDTFASSDLLTLDEDSIVITPIKELAEVGNSAGPNGFTRVIKEMAHGEKVTITYSADVDESKLDPNGQVTGDDGKNTVTVDDYHEEKTHIVNEIKFSDLHKVTTSQTDEGNSVRMSWEITANTDLRASLVGSTITDRIAWDSKDIMKYARTDSGKVRLYVTGTDAGERVYPQDAPAVIELSPTVDSSGQESWTWTVTNLGEDADTPLSYSITYDTIAEKQAGSNVAVKNDATNESGGSDTGVGVVPERDPEGSPIVVDKVATDVTSKYVDWDIVINVPEEGFNSLVVTDSLPSTWVKNHFGKDTIEVTSDSPLTDNVHISGLQGTERYTLAYNEKAGQNKAAELVITFYKDQTENPANPGLNRGARTITISIRTKNDPEWLDLVAAGEDSKSIHTNTAMVNNVTVTADAAPVKRKIDKSFAGESKAADGLPQYQYYVTLSGVENLEDFSFTDTFDSRYLELVEPSTYQASSSEYQIAGNDKPWSWNRNNDYLKYEEIEPGQIRFFADSLPTKDNGDYFAYYRATYFLKVKDAAALADLKDQALKRGGKYTLKNTAVWGDLPDECEVEYEVKVIDKEGYFATAEPDERKYTFVIDVNPDRFDLSVGDTVELTDQHTNNLSVDYSSVKIYEIPVEATIVPDAKYAAQHDQLQSTWLCAPGSIPWNFVGNRGTFTLEDQTRYVIVYDAIVIGSGKQEFKNIADLEGFKDFKEEERIYSSGTTAGGDIWEIKLLKYKDGLTSHGLQGATFQLFKGIGEYYQETDGTWIEHKEPMKYGDTASTRLRGLVGKDITFTTDDSGLVTIKLNERDDGNELEGGVHYYLKEIESPAGYKIDSSTEYWSFTLTTDPDEVNYGDPKRRDEYGNLQWIYFYYNDILKMANTETTDPLKVIVNKSWYDENGNPITGENINQTPVAKVQLMRKTDNGEYVPVKVEQGTGEPVVTEVPDNPGESQVELTRQNNWSYTWENLPRAELGGPQGFDIIHRYAYKIEEVELDGYVASISETETGTVKTYALKNYKIPKNRTTDVTVNKEWRDAEGQEIPGTTESLPNEITFELYRAVSTTPFTRVPTTGGSLYVISGDSHLVDSGASEGSDNYGLYKLTRSDADWTVTFEGLPEVVTENGQTYYYAYYVKERPVTGYTTTYTSNGTTRTIVNREPSNNTIDIGLKKEWTDGTNTTQPQGATAVFTVHQQKSTASSSGPQGDIAVNLVDSNGEPIASVMASDTDRLLVSGFVFADSENITVNAWIQCVKEVSWGTSSFNVGYIQQSHNGSIHNAEITVNEAQMANNKVIVLKLAEKAIADFSTPPVLTNTSASSSTTYSEYENTEFTRTVVLPTADEKWEATIKGLVKQDTEGNRYRYYITEDSCAPTTASVEFKDQDGFDIKDADQSVPTTKPIDEGGKTVVATNTYETTDFAFAKEWHDVSDQIDNTWRDDITVSVQRKIGSGTSEMVGKYTIHKEDSGFKITKGESTPEAPELVNHNNFTFKISGLLKNGTIGNVTGEYTYFVTEETVSGYRDPAYSNPPASSDEGETDWTPSADYALNNGKIINRPEDSVELPAAGGPGTTLFRLFGIMLIGLAGVVLVMPKRRRRRRAV